MANGSMPQAVQSGALMPATAIAAIDVLRLCPRLSSAQNVSGASAARLICTYLAVVPSAPPVSDVVLSAPIAPAAVAKYTGSDTVLASRSVEPPISSDPKLYLLACPLESSSVALAAAVASVRP